MLSLLYGRPGQPSTAATRYLSVSNNNATESVVSLVCPDSFTFSKLYVEVTTAPSVGKSWTFALMKNGVATGLTCTISDTATFASDNANSVSFAAGDTYSLQCIPSGTPTSSGILYWNLTTSGPGQIIPLPGSSSFGNTTLNLVSLMGGTGQTTESSIQTVMPTAGTFTKMYAVLSGAPTGGDSVAIKFRKNAADSGPNVTISGANTTGNDTSNTSSVVAGDRVSITYQETGTTSSLSMRVTLLFTPTVDGESFVGMGLGDTPDNTNIEYNTQAVAGSEAWTTTEIFTIFGNWLIKKLYGRTNTGAGAGKNRILTVRKNSADTSLAVTMTNTTTEQSALVPILFDQGNKFAYKTTPTGTPTTARINTGMLITAPKSAIATLTDSFAAQDTAKWDETTGGSATISYAGGTFDVTFPGSSTAATVGALTSDAEYDLTGSSAYVQVTTLPSAATAANGELRLSIDANNWVRFVTESGTIYAQKMVNGSRSNIDTATYNSSTHAWWKISESGGTLTFATSSDGSSWTTFGTPAANPISVVDLKIYLAGSCYQNETNPGHFTADNFNTPPSSPPANTTNFFQFM